MKKKGDTAEALRISAPKRDFIYEQDGFVGSLYRPEQDAYPGKVLICFSGSDGLIYGRGVSGGCFLCHTVIPDFV